MLKVNTELQDEQVAFYIKQVKAKDFKYNKLGGSTKAIRIYNC